MYKLLSIDLSDHLKHSAAEFIKAKRYSLKFESEPLSLSGMSSVPLTLKKHPCLLTSSKDIPSTCPVFASIILYFCLFFLFFKGNEMWPSALFALFELRKLNVRRSEKRLPPFSSCKMKDERKMFYKTTQIHRLPSLEFQ